MLVGNDKPTEDSCRTNLRDKAPTSPDMMRITCAYCGKTIELDRFRITPPFVDPNQYLNDKGLGEFVFKCDCMEQTISNDDSRFLNCFHKFQPWRWHEVSKINTSDILGPKDLLKLLCRTASKRWFTQYDELEHKKLLQLQGKRG